MDDPIDCDEPELSRNLSEQQKYSNTTNTQDQYRNHVADEDNISSGTGSVIEHPIRRSIHSNNTGSVLVILRQQNHTKFVHGRFEMILLYIPPVIPHHGGVKSCFGDPPTFAKHLFKINRVMSFLTSQNLFLRV